MQLTELSQPIGNHREIIDTKVVKNLCFVGAGHVGGPTAAVTALQNPHLRVTVVDKDSARIQQWNSRHLPLREPGLSEVLRIGRDGTKATILRLQDAFDIKVPARQPNLFFSIDLPGCLSDADIIFLCVNTPTKHHGIGANAATDLTALEKAVKDIAIFAKTGAIIVEKSTVPCWTAGIIRDILQFHRPDDSFEILSNPEFLAEGTAIGDLLNPDRIIIGSSHSKSALKATATLGEIYAAWVDRSKIISVNLWSSELAKLVANAMLAQRISSINTISEMCENIGADINEIAKVVGMDSRLGPEFLKAGVGFGGSCFKKDILSLIYLAETLKLEKVAEYWRQVVNVNNYQGKRFVERAMRCLNRTLVGKKITLFGFAFKKNTNDARESPTIEVIRLLLLEKPDEIAIFDPGFLAEELEVELGRLFPKINISPSRDCETIRVCSDPYEACENSNAILILTDWDHFRYPPVPPKSSAFRLPQPIPLAYTVSETGTFFLTQSHPPQSTDLFDRYLPEPECGERCGRCAHELTSEKVAIESVDWERISGDIRLPRWVFDGRGVVDIVGMKELGFRVEAIGKVGSGSQLDGFPKH